MDEQRRKAEAFAALHHGPAFVIPNPWDAGSARVLEALGFQALATTSSGFALSLGRRDGGASFDDVVAHVGGLARASSLPVTVDLEHGHGPAAEDAGRAIERVAGAGAVGGSIEDWDPVARRLYERSEAVERVAAAVEAARALDFPFTLTARAENHLRGNPDLGDTIARLQAYEAAGADVLYAPFLQTLEEIAAVCAAVTKPVNVLARPHLTVAGIADAGGRRISVGGGLAWVAMRAAADAAIALRDRGDLSVLSAQLPLDNWF